jgi:DNA-dependent protein kinase catalytic subunit
MALHPSATKRMGAALAFNSIYRVFREQNALVDRFVMEMIAVMMQSLQMAHRDDKDLGTQAATSQSVQHLQRIIVARVCSLIFVRG